MGSNLAGADPSSASCISTPKASQTHLCARFLARIHTGPSLRRRYVVEGANEAVLTRVGLRVLVAYTREMARCERMRVSACRILVWKARNSDQMEKVQGCFDMDFGLDDDSDPFAEA